MDRPNRIDRLDRLAHLLDSAFPIPGTDITIGIDPLIGIIPGIGDAISTLLSGAILYEAARMGAPKHVLMRMVGNVGADALVGAVPVLGDLFDCAFRANRRNVELLRSLPATSFSEVRDSRAIGRLVAAALFIALVLILAAAGHVAYVLIELISS